MRTSCFQVANEGNQETICLISPSGVKMVKKQNKQELNTCFFWSWLWLIVQYPALNCCLLPHSVSFMWTGAGCSWPGGRAPNWAWQRQLDLHTNFSLTLTGSTLWWESWNCLHAIVVTTLRPKEKLRETLRKMNGKFARAFTFVLYFYCQ